MNERKRSAVPQKSFNAGEVDVLQPGAPQRLALQDVTDEEEELSSDLLYVDVQPVVATGVHCIDEPIALNQLMGELVG
jgi:hypothetical protein